MKKIILACAILFCAGYASAENEVRANYNISGFKYASSVNSSSFTIVAPGGGLKNCLTGWTLTSNTAANLTIQEGTLQSGTTIWGLINSSPTYVANIQTNEKDALCGGPNAQLVIVVSSGAASMNYRGYVRERP